MKPKLITITALLTLFSILAFSPPTFAGSRNKVRLKRNSVSTPKIRDGAITLAKIADGAVSGTKIATGAVSGTKIATGAVSGTKIAGGAVTADKLSADIAVWTDVSGNAVRSTGGVGIGITPTRGALEVAGFIANNPSPGTAGFFNSFGTASSGTTAVTSISIYATDEIWGSQFIADSDARIKNIKGISDPAVDLQTLIGIEITDYLHKDLTTKGSREQKKVIAQQVEVVFPQAVIRSTDVVPDIYQRASVAEGWVALATDLKVGERVRLIGEKEQGIHEVLEIREGAFRTSFAPGSDKVFVYGREVEDFRSVDYDAISMLNVSATQELYRKNLALEQRVAALEAENALRDAKLTAIEKMLGNGGTKLVSLETVGAGQ